MPATATEAPTYLSLQESLAEINKRYGPDTMIRADRLQVPGRITTGSLSLDVMLGGGWPTNQWHEVFGEFSSGKSALALQTVAANQKADPNFTTVWFAAEPYDKAWAEKNGIDNERVLVMETNIMEHVYEAALLIMKNRAADLVVIDSLPALVPIEEDEKDGWTVGLAARLNNKFFNRKAPHAMKRSMTEVDRPCTGIVINQWREKIGVMFGDNRVTPGGKGKDFAFYTRVEVRRSEWLKVKEARVGIEITARTHKNKSAPAQRAAKLDFYFDVVPGHPAGQYDRVKDIYGTAVYMGIITSGAHPRFGEVKLGRTIAEGQQAMREDLDLQREVFNATLAVISHKSDPEPLAEPEKPAKLTVKR